ncbi:hypothetical protein [Galbibacter sp. PAP.153]|uniref:hypothetical protein n=1 Tax=Galbibacter sp. PAP.153 TaxID=3104623 RepID=UPI0030090C5A
MPINKYLKVKDINLDLKNYRTIPQKTEADAINAMIAIKPERFYAVVESLIDASYLPTENLIILDDNGYTVKEGNRRTAALKLIHGLHPIDDFTIPDSLKAQIRSLDKSWKEENKQVPCSIYTSAEKNKVDKIVNLTHAKGEKASRDPWTSVAKARQNRNEKKASEPALDLLEKYIEQGKNLTGQQKERWSGDYPLTVLDEALRTIISRLGFATLTDLAKVYPKIKNRSDLEDMLRDIGLKVFGFKEIRSKASDFASRYNIPNPTLPPTSSNQGGNNSQNTNSTSSQSSRSSNKGQSQANSTNNSSSSNPQSTGQSASTQNTKPKAYAIHDQRTVTQTLKKFNPKGSDRAKLVTLRDELKKLKVKTNPIAFCFILRSMFEISANIYSNENNIPKDKTRNGKKIPNTLKQQLNAVTRHLTSNNKNSGMVKTLHGANSELSKSTGLLSVTSMNQLVHNPSFAVASHDIFVLFNNVYPLLEAMN